MSTLVGLCWGKFWSILLWLFFLTWISLRGYLYCVQLTSTCSAYVVLLVSFNFTNSLLMYMIWYSLDYMYFLFYYNAARQSLWATVRLKGWIHWFLWSAYIPFMENYSNSYASIDSCCSMVTPSRSFNCYFSCSPSLCKLVLLISHC